MKDGRARGVVLASVLMIASSVVVVRAEETVGLWVKNTAPMPVTVMVDGAEACKLEAPVYKTCKDDLSIPGVAPEGKGKGKGKKEPAKAQEKFCTTNNLRISCITNVKASGADVVVQRLDGVSYKLRAAKGGTLYLCIEPNGLTDCFGKKLQ